MGRLIDLTGQRFGRLVAIERVESRGKNRAAVWRCRCDCGKETFVRSDSLRSGMTMSCGCFNIDQKRNLMMAQNIVHGGYKTRLYNIWHNMKKRCYNPLDKYYKDYGGRGITICAEWLHDFVAFRDWALSHGYQDDLTIDRINNDGNYSPDNCRWATWKEQRINQRPRKKKGG